MVEPGNELVLSCSPQSGQHGDTVSYSRLKVFRTCPEKYRILKHEKLLPDPPSAAAIQGTAFHETYELWERSGRCWTPKYVGEKFEEVYDTEILRRSSRTPQSEWIVWGRGNNIQKDIDTRRENGKNQIVEYVNYCLSSEWKLHELPDESPALEVRFNVKLGEFKITGSIDQILEWPDGSLTIRDLKTGGRESTALQLGIYAYAANRTLGLDITRGDWYYAKDGTLSVLQDLRRFDEDYLHTQFKTMTESIRLGLFYPSPSGDCFNCPAKRLCRDFR